MPAATSHLLLDMNSLEAEQLQSVALELSTMELSKSFGKLGLDAPSRDDTSGRAGLGPASAQDTDQQQPLKKSANMTAECVDVPTSEHVAEIVGRQGCKIKALRAKTNTYIRTPVRGEAPVFVVTGRKEDVALAKKEILSAAEHFSQIRASRRNNSNGGLHGPPSPGTPGQVTIQVRVPYRVVGLVVGPKGATIKRIQQQAQTYIVTPSRDKEPIFEVTGLPENVEKARREIESHIALRTGGSLSDGPLVGNVRPMHVGGNQIPDDRLNDFQTNGIDAGSHDLHDLMNSMYKPPSSNSAFTSYRSNTYPQDSNVFAYPSKLPESHGFGSNGSFGLYDSDEGIGSSPSFDSNPIGTLSGNSIWSDFMDMPVSSIMNPLAEGLTSNAQCLSPTGSTNFEGVDNSTRRFTNGELTNIGLSGMSAFTPFHQNDSRLRGTSATFGVSGSTSTSPTDSTGSLGNQRQNCFGSLDNEVSPW